MLHQDSDTVMVMPIEFDEGLLIELINWCWF